MNARKIAVAGVLSALAIFLGIPPIHLGYIPWFAGASLTIMAAPVIIGAILEGPIVGLLIGLLFGLSSLVNAAVAPTGPSDVLFTNPLVSVLPRLLIGPVAWLIYRPFSGRARPIGIVLAGIGGSLTNTVLVLCMIVLLGKIGWVLAGTIAATNGAPEAAANALLSLAVVAAWKRIELGRKGANLE
ncbi:MAG TPA: ECF transporter S component [Spirochaetia bacterium]|nr:ECF transporter S component [Spirochaetia bacterium]